jgi:hypothetical protein
MLRGMLVTLIMVVLAAAPGSSQEKSPARPIGTWVKDQGDAKITFKMSADTFQCIISGGGVTLTVEGDYGVSKDGVIFGRISRVDRQGTDVGPMVGELFSFKYAIKKDVMTLSDMRGASAGEARALIEGDYKGEAKKEKSK